MAEKISKHAEELRKRGFKPLAEADPEAASGASTDPWDQFADRMKGLIRSATGTTRRERRKLKAMKAHGFFTRFPGFTHAIDEHGAEWVCGSEVGLADLGFIDNGPLYLQMKHGIRPN
jgi:hypothetical protein